MSTTLLLLVLLLQPRGLDANPGLQEGPYSGPLPPKYERTVVREAVLFEMGPGIGKAVVVLAEGEPVEIFRIVVFIDGRPHLDRITNVVFRLGEEPDPESTGVAVRDLDGDGRADLVFNSAKGERRYVFAEMMYRPQAP